MIIGDKEDEFENEGRRSRPKITIKPKKKNESIGDEDADSRNPSRLGKIDEREEDELNIKNNPIRRIDISDTKKIKKIEISSANKLKESGSKKRFKISNEVVNFDKGNSTVPFPMGLHYGNKIDKSSEQKDEEFPVLPSANLNLPKINIGPPFRERYDEGDVMAPKNKNIISMKKTGKKFLNPMVKRESNFMS